MKKYIKYLPYTIAFILCMTVLPPLMLLTGTKLPICLILSFLIFAGISVEINKKMCRSCCNRDRTSN